MEKYIIKHKNVVIDSKKTYTNIVCTDPHSVYNVADGNWLTNTFTKYKDRGVAVVSGERFDQDDEERLATARRLAEKIRQAGFGYRQAFGGYTYQEGEDTVVAKGELSFIIPLPADKTEKELYDLAISLGKEFGQESVAIWLPSFNSGRPSWVSTLPDNFGEITKSFNTISVATDKTNSSGWTGERKKGEAASHRAEPYSSLAFAFKDADDYDVICYRVPGNSYQGYLHANNIKKCKDEFIVEQTLKNALAFSKKEIEKYWMEPNAYGGIQGMADAIQYLYHLRDDEKEYLINKLKEYVNKNEFLDKWREE